jgi:hypothetical protein
VVVLGVVTTVAANNEVLNVNPKNKITNFLNIIITPLLPLALIS